ncbi:MAG TPA: glycosyltransferase [Phycisphaerales bacterium]|nr:glycosyltransferase [Phycisphaerales bacterium]
MLPSIYLPEKYESRFSLLTAFCSQFGDACRARGLRVNPPRNPNEPAIFAFFNLAGSDTLARWIGPRAASTAVVQWIVDHPFMLDQRAVGELARLPNYRLLTVADDDVHLLQLRWPGMTHARLWHGVPRGALCDAGSLVRSHEDRAVRDIDVLVCGSLASDDEVAKRRAEVPPSLHKACDEIVRLRLAHPHMPFGQAFDIAVAGPVRTGDHWGLMATIARYATHVVNRERRLALLRGLAGLRVAVVGTPTWRGHCGGTLAYAGEVEFTDIHTWMARARVCVCINPTQFTHAFSERLLLALGAGSGVVSDDRLHVREEFVRPGGEACAVFPATLDEGPPLLRERVEHLLGSIDARVGLAARGRAAIESSHLWEHRVDSLLAAAGYRVEAAAAA